ncbi:MAG: divergent polysaccharide deacetylase family protein [Terriglobia bacterium]
MKELPYAPFPPRRADAAAEAVVASSAFPEVLSAMEAQAQKEGIEINTRISAAHERWRLADLRLTRRRQPAGRWLIREVGQLRRAAIIIDDLGQDLAAANALLGFPYPLTFSVLPHLPHSAETAEKAHREGREVMLHLPMEPESSAKPGPGEIRVGMREAEVDRLLDQNLGSVPYAAGVNNHMGSRATTDAALMREVVKVLHQRRLFFVDSRTTAQSVAFEVARKEELPSFYRSVFLDDTETVPYTLGQLREFLHVIESQGVAIAIGHPYPSTIQALRRFLPEFERSDIQLVPASELLSLPETAHLRPPPAPEQRQDKPR